MADGRAAVIAMVSGAVLDALWQEYGANVVEPDAAVEDAEYERWKAVAVAAVEALPVTDDPLPAPASREGDGLGRLAAVADGCVYVHVSAVGGVLLRVYGDTPHERIADAFATDVRAALAAAPPAETGGGWWAAAANWMRRLGPIEGFDPLTIQRLINALDAGASHSAAGPGGGLDRALAEVVAALTEREAWLRREVRQGGHPTLLDRADGINDALTRLALLLATGDGRG